MTVTDAEVIAKGEAVRDKAVEKWIEMECHVPAVMLGDEAVGTVRDAFEVIPAYYRMFTGRSTGGIQAMRDHLTDTATTFDSLVVGGIDTLKTDVLDWRGEAAENFTREFLEDLPEIKDNQLALIADLENALAMTQALIEGNRQVLIDAGNDTIELLDAMEDSGGGMSFGLALVAAITTVMAGIATFGTGSAAVAAGWFTVMAGASSFAASVAAEMQSRELGIEGDDVGEVIESLLTSIQGLWDVKEEKEQQLARDLATDLEQAALHGDRLMPVFPTVLNLDLGQGLTPEVRERFEPPRG